MSINNPFFTSLFFMDSPPTSPIERAYTVYHDNYEPQYYPIFDTRDEERLEIERMFPPSDLGMSEPEVNPISVQYYPFRSLYEVEIVVKELRRTQRQ